MEAKRICANANATVTVPHLLSRQASSMVDLEEETSTSKEAAFYSQASSQDPNMDARRMLVTANATAAVRLERLLQGTAHAKILW